MQTRTVKTYFAKLGNGPSDPPVLRAWRDNWKKRGWSTRILSESDAAHHALYKRFKARCESFPTVNPKAYEMACWMRWLAFAQSGGGMMVDFDVVNRCYQQVKMMDEPENVVILAKGRVPCAVIATPKGAERIAQDIFSHHAKFTDHYSDMYFFIQSSYPSVELCVEAGDTDWQEAPLVHYSHNSCNVHGWNRIEGMKSIVG